jgi:hypothetical protein
VAAAIATIFGVVIGATTLLLALLNIREKLAPKPAPIAHPLETALRDIAAAVRERPPYSP